MKSKLSIIILILFSGFSGYSQDSIRTKNDKPGTPQSLRKSDQTPQSHIQVINSNVAPGQTDINKPSESHTINNTTPQTITTDVNSKPLSTNPNTLTTNPPENMGTTTNSSAIQNGISNAGKPIRKQR